MGAVVMKFGGSSVADAAAIEQVVDIVARVQASGRAPVVVVSAMAGVTDSLLTLANAAGIGQTETVNDGLRELSRRHLEAAHRLVPAAPAALDADIERQIDELREAFERITIVREAHPRALDAVAATGELLSSRIVAAAIASRGLRAAWIDPRSVIKTNDHHTAASPLTDDTRDAAGRALTALVAAGTIPVTGGFVGSTVRGVTTTLGRGGSDYSASIIGAAIGASEIQIWTDVDGMLTADPRIVADTQVVPQLSFAEASELAYFGAKVLHPSTILPAVSRNIPVRILNSRRPNGEGTLITGTPQSGGERPLTAIACKRGITVIDITSDRMLMAYGFLRHVFETFEHHRTPVDVVTTSEVSVSVTIDDCRHVASIVMALGQFAEVSVEERMAIICVVGDALRTRAGLAARVVGALADFPLRMVSQAASRRNLTIVLPESHLVPAVTHLHDELFAPAGAR